MSRALILLGVCSLTMLFGIFIGRLHRDRPGAVRDVYQSSGWASHKLPADAFTVDRSKWWLGVIRLRRDVMVEGVMCKANTWIGFDERGRLQSGTLAMDQDVCGLPLKGGSAFWFASARRQLIGFTLRAQKRIGGVLCAPGKVTLFSGQWPHLCSAQLASDTIFQGILCSAGTPIVFERGWLGVRLLRCTLKRRREQFGLFCEAGTCIDFFERSGTLAVDTRYAGVLLPAASQFAHDIDWGHLCVRAAVPVNAFGHILPVAAQLSFRRRNSGEHPRCRLANDDNAILPMVLSVYAAERWWIFDSFAIEKHQRVAINAAGMVEICLEYELILAGVCYRRGSRVLLDRWGRVVRLNGKSLPPAAAGPNRARG